MTGNKEFADSIKEKINLIIENMGYKIVETRLGITHKQQHLSIIIYRPEGISLNDCSRVSKKIKPELEIEELADLTIEVSSPGTDRIFKSLEELTIFQGRGIKVLLNDNTEWLGGVIGEVTATDFVLIQRGKLMNISKNDIKKIKLDHTEEVNKTKCQQS